MAGTHGHFICFLYIFMLDFYSYIFMSTALKKTHWYSSLMKLCRAATRKYRPKDKLMRSVLRALFLESR